MSQFAPANLILRVGLAFVFLYPAINAYFEPYTWIGYFPPFTRGYVDEFLMLHVFGVVEIVIALWLLSGWKVFYPALVAGVMLVAIVVTNTSDFPILFRDLGLAAAAFHLALANPRNSAYP